MSESAPFSIGVWPDGGPKNPHVDAEFLQAKEFSTTNQVRYSKEVGPGKRLVYDLSTCQLLIQNGESEPIVVAEYSPGIQYLEGIYKTMTGQNL